MIRNWTPEIMIEDMTEIAVKNSLATTEEDKEMIRNIVSGYIKEETKKKGFDV